MLPLLYSATALVASFAQGEGVATPGGFNLLPPSHIRNGSGYGAFWRSFPRTEAPLVDPIPKVSLSLSFMDNVTFSTNDLHNWKAQNPPSSEKPEALISFLETVFYTHQLTWW